MFSQVYFQSSVFRLSVKYVIIPVRISHKWKTAPVGARVGSLKCIVVSYLAPIIQASGGTYLVANNASTIACQ